MNLRAQPLLLMLVFFGPLALAAVAFYGPWDLVPTDGTAHGTLIQPPVPLPPAPLSTQSGGNTAVDWFARRWSLIYATNEHCGEPCFEDLNRLNQVRLALAEDREHVQLVFLLANEPAELPVDPALIVARLDDPAGRVMLELLHQHQTGNGRVFLADPLGNLVMSYPLDAEQKGILKDIKRLLRVLVVG